MLFRSSNSSRRDMRKSGFVVSQLRLVTPYRKPMSGDRHGVVRWRCVDLQQRIREEFLVELHESTVGKLLRQIVVPAHVGASAASAQQAG